MPESAVFRMQSYGHCAFFLNNTFVECSLGRHPGRIAAFDVTRFLHQGKNVISLQLGGDFFQPAEERIRELISLILVLPERLNGQARNQTRINYFRMFFTDSMVDILHTEGEMIRISHERDLFDAMNLSFLDFFMEEPCRTAREIIRTNLKLYGQMVKGRPMNTPEQPLPNDVYMQYMQDVEGTKLKSASAITNQRMAYRAFLEENLC